jgi:flagellar M-ring protein FliF
VKNADVRKWTDQISAAAGIDPEREDVIQVTTVAFDKTAQKAAEKQLEGAAASGSKQNMLDLVRQIVALAIVALVLFFAWRAIKRAEASRVPLRVPLDLRELEAASAALPSGTASLEAGAAADYERRLLPATTGVTGDITELIERQPDDVAQTLRSWLADRRT